MTKPVILCVDDDRIVLEALTEQLQQRLGNAYEIEIAENGQEALEILDELHVEVPIAIVDYFMPGMRGDELMRQIHLKSSETLTILLSGKIDNEGIGQSINTGHLHRYITKPWNKEQLLLIINEAIDVFTHEKLIREHRKEMEALNASLEQKITERTNELEKRNKQLQKAQQAAEAANNAKSVFLANMTHEFRSPLSSILGYTHIIRREKNLTQKQCEQLNIIHQSGEHLLMLINDLLDISRSEIDQLKIYPTSLYLPTFLDNIIGIIRMRAEQKALHLVSEIDNNLPIQIKADEKRLRQVLLNLLCNALKFTNVGTVILRVKSIKGAIRFEIQDTGIGMTQEQQKKIFIPFEQVGDEEHRAQGSGLGLAITRQLLKLMNSKIQVKSEQGEGSIFLFEVNFPKIENSPVKPVRKEDLSIIQTPPPLKELKILYDFAKLGDMRHIRDWIVRLETLNEQYLPFVSRVKNLTKAYDGRQIAELARFWMTKYDD